MTIEEAIEYAEGALNHNWTLDVRIYNGSSSVELFDHEGDLVWSQDETSDIAEQIVKACGKSHGL